MKKSILLISLLSMQTTMATSIMIDLDVNTAGVQNSITDATEGQVINFALVATNFTGDIHCYNGIGGDISSKGSMSVTYSPDIHVGDIANYTANGMLRDIAPPFSPNTGSSIISGDAVNSLQLNPLTGYTKNVGGVGLRDFNAQTLDSNGHVVSFTNSPVGPAPQVTIFTASLTLSNVAGNTLDLFPSGVFNNPPSITEPDGITLNAFEPFGFQQDGDIMLHNRPHNIDNQCQAIGPGNIFGATITGVPEPSSTLLLGLGGLTLISRRKRSD